MNSSGTLKIARNGYIVMAVVFCALGIFLMAVPEKAVKIICVLAGILFIADGIIKIIGYFSRDFYCLAFQFDLGFGILMIAVGILILVSISTYQDCGNCRKEDIWRAVSSGRRGATVFVRRQCLSVFFTYKGLVQCISGRNS